jgi:hypothetical protein
MERQLADDTGSHCLRHLRQFLMVQPEDIYTPAKRRRENNDNRCRRL